MKPRGLMKKNDLWNGILKHGNFKKHGILWMKGILKTRKFLKNVEFYG